MVVQTLSKFGVQILPAVCASVLSAAVLAALQLTPASTSQPQRANTDLGDDTVYIDVLPRINREPAPPVAAPKPVVAETPAPLALAVQPAVTPIAPARTPAPRPNPTVTAKVDPVPKVPAAKNEPIQIAPIPVVTAPAAQAPTTPPAEATANAPASITPMPPLPIVEASAVNPQPPAEQSRVLGMRVPRPVSDAGGAVVDIAKLPIQFADTLVARPVWRVGEKIVSGVTGLVGGR